MVGVIYRSERLASYLRSEGLSTSTATSPQTASSEGLRWLVHHLPTHRLDLADEQLRDALAGVRSVVRADEVDYGLLVVPRGGEVGQWWAYLDLHTVLELTGCLGPRVHDNLPNPVVRMTLADATHLLRHAGYGDSPVEESA